MRDAHGLPIGVKDLMDTADMPTAYGSPIYAGHRPAWDAAVVAAARAAGAIVVGKTVTTEFATFTPAATVNPRDFEHTPGGSSSGSAAAVADGMVPLAFGTQTVGSIIRPASFCGVVGYKPTFGTLSRAGVKLLAESLDTVGAIARTVDDVALMVGALSGRDELVDLAKIDRPWVGLCRTHDWRETQPEVGDGDGRGRARARRGGRARDPGRTAADFAALGDAHGDILGYEIARNLGFEHAHHGVRLSSRLRELLDAGAQVTADALRPRARARASRPRGAARRVRRVPRVPRAEHDRRGAGRASSPPGNPVMNRVWTLLHVPCVTVPVATGPNGLPVGLQVIGRIGDDARTLSAARWIHERLGAG